jgi:hypothetical protein
VCGLRNLPNPAPERLAYATGNVGRAFCVPRQGQHPHPHRAEAPGWVDWSLTRRHLHARIICAAGVRQKRRVASRARRHSEGLP